MTRTITLHAAAPAKPALGETCNGCGVCCAAEPCPISLIFLLQRRGRCRALVWQAERSRYVCGMVSQPASFLRWLPLALDHWAGRQLARRIAAGTGCDAEVDVERAA